MDVLAWMLVNVRAVQWLMVVSALLVRAVRVLLMVSALMVRAIVMVPTELAVVRRLIACLAVASIVVEDFLASTKIEAAKLMYLLMMASNVPAGFLPKWHLDVQKNLVPMDPQMAASRWFWHRCTVYMCARLAGCQDPGFLWEPWQRMAKAS